MSAVYTDSVLVSVFESILLDLIDVPLNQALDKHQVKSSEFFNYLARNADAKALFDAQTHCIARKLALETVDISDNEPDPARANVRIKARQWLASKYLPKEYGERIDVSVQTVDLTDALREARARRERVLHPSFTEAKQLTDVSVNIGIQSGDATDLESVASLASMLE